MKPAAAVDFDSSAQEPPFQVFRYRQPPLAFAVMLARFSASAITSLDGLVIVAVALARDGSGRLNIIGTLVSGKRWDSMYHVARHVTSPADAPTTSALAARLGGSTNATLMRHNIYRDDYVSIRAREYLSATQAFD